MNIIQKAISDIRYKIPAEILDLTFRKTDYQGRQLPISIESKIRELVIHARVLVDCNITGGEQILINISELVPQWVQQPYSAVYHIPKALTRGKTISTALSITYGSALLGASQFSPQSISSNMLDAANQVLQSNLSIPQISTAVIELIGENIIWVRDTMSIPSMLWLRCIIENDENLNNIKPQYALDFGKLVEYATKAYIYNTLNIQLDIGQLHGGMNLGKIREVVDGYSDANELYETYLEENWRKMSIMNDKETNQRVMALAVGGGF